jgi:hypothetical protein
VQSDVDGDGLSGVDEAAIGLEEVVVGGGELELDEERGTLKYAGEVLLLRRVNLNGR